MTESKSDYNIYLICIFVNSGTMARKVDFQNHTAYCLYQADSVPGSLISTPGSCQTTYNLQSTSMINLCKINVSNNMVVIGKTSDNDFSVGQNFPNPAASSTKIPVTLRKTSFVRIEIADVLGNIIYSESEGKLTIGSHQIFLNTSAYAKGVYTYRVYAGELSVTRRMVVQ